MTEVLKPDICVIGAGSAGLVVAAGGSQMGAEVVLIEKGKMGGDCLNYGCVPSKALLAAGKAAAAGLGASPFGVDYAAPGIDFQRVHDHVHGVIAGIAPVDSVERFEGLGVKVVKAEARFTSPRELVADGLRIQARRFVVATGSTPLVPPIPGLEDVPFLTNETAFDLTERPKRLVVIGGGAIGCELGQAFRHLGSEVAILEMASILPKDEPEVVAVLRRALRRDGVELLEDSRVTRVEAEGDGIVVHFERGGEPGRVEGDRLLVAAGRQPGVNGLDLDAAGVAYDRRGITVDRRLRSSNKKVYAIGDVAGGLQFTHVAGYHAGVALKNILFRLPAKADTSAVPWVTYTEPEVAQVGLTEAQARDSHGAIRILRWPFAENDRAQTERRTEGLVKAVTSARGKVLGCSIVGAHAGELILPWVLAISAGLKIGALAQAVAPYPTFSEVSKRAAGGFFTPSLFSARTRRLVRFLRVFG